MANIKSQKKRAITNQKSRQANVKQKTEVKNAIKKVLAAVDGKDKEAAVSAYNNANSILDKAVSNGVKKKNYASRQKSRLAKAVNSVE